MHDYSSNDSSSRRGFSVEAEHPPAQQQAVPGRLRGMSAST